MNLHLKTLEFWSDKNSGWQSGPLPFGQSFTFVSGENTCGKTPLLRGIFFALGVPSNFRNDILENCAGVRLEVELAGVPYIFQRTFAERDKVQIRALRDGAVVSLPVEKEVSKFIFDKLGYPEVKVTTTKAAESSVYLSTIAPLFWKEQLNSWDTIYHTQNRFIDDQREEAMRFLLGLQPRNPFGVKAEIKREKKNID